MPILRLIRQQLASQSTFRNYLPYALGEIVLVVAGILIALRVNNWNETRKERAQETGLINVLIDDLNDRKDELVGDIGYGELLIREAHAALAGLKAGEVDTIGLKNVLRRIGEDWWFFNDQSATYISLTNSPLWNRLPDSLTLRVNGIYNVSFGLVKNAFGKSTEYATYCKLHFLVPNDLLLTDRDAAEIRRQILQDPVQYAGYLKLFLDSTERLIQYCRSAVIRIDEAVERLEAHNARHAK